MGLECRSIRRPCRAENPLSGGWGARSVVVADVFSHGPWLKFWEFLGFYFDENPMTYTEDNFQQWNIFRNCCHLFHIPSSFKFVVGWLQMWPQFFTPPCTHTLCNMILLLFPLRERISFPTSGIWAGYALANGMASRNDGVPVLGLGFRDCVHSHSSLG